MKRYVLCTAFAILASVVIPASSLGAAPAPALSGAPNPFAPPITVQGQQLPGGGVQVDPWTVAYNQGQVELTVLNKGTPGARVATPSQVAAGTAGSPSPASTASPATDVYVIYDCPDYELCLYRENNWLTKQGQTFWHARGGGYYQLSAYNFNDVMSSWTNHRSNDSAVTSDWCGSPCGASLSLPAHQHSPSVSANWNDVASGVKNY